MSLFDGKADRPGRSDAGKNKRTDIQTWDGTYLGYTLQADSSTDAISPTEGWVGKYDHFSDTTYDSKGVPIGKGNWLMSLFRRG